MVTRLFAIDIKLGVGPLDLDVCIPRFKGTIALVGPNGAGKTTLLLSLLGALRVSAGNIQLHSQTLYSADQNIDVPMEDRRIGYVPQKYGLFTHMTVTKNVAFGIRGFSKEEKKKQVRKLLQELDIGHLAHRKTSSLSGGESQRVALARALAIRPKALLLDEPMAALDAGARKRVRRFLGDRLKVIGIPTIVVSHDIEDVVAFGQQIAVLEKGKIVQVGTLDALRRAPATSFVAQFLAGDNK